MFGEGLMFDKMVGGYYGSKRRWYMNKDFFSLYIWLLRRGYFKLWRECLLGEVVIISVRYLVFVFVSDL